MRGFEDPQTRTSLRRRNGKNNGPTHLQYVEPLNEKETVVNHVTKTRLVIALLVAIGFASSWHRTLRSFSRRG